MVRQVGLLISPPWISILVPFFSSEETDKKKKVMFHSFYLSICRHTAALLQFQTTPRFDAWLLMLWCGHTVFAGVLQHRTILAAPHASTSRCEKSPRPVLKGVDSGYVGMMGLTWFCKVFCWLVPQPPTPGPGRRVLWEGVPGGSASAKPGTRWDWPVSGGLETFPDLTWTHTIILSLYLLL